MATRVGEKIPYSTLNAQWAPYLTEKHAKELGNLTKAMEQASQNPGENIKLLMSAMQRVDVFHKRVQKRQTIMAHISNFIQERDKELPQFQEHQKRLKQLGDNNPAFKTCMNCTENYLAFSVGLKKLAQKTLDTFKERKFDKGVRALYPQMMKDICVLLKNADMVKEVKEMPEHKVKKDLLFFFEKGTLFQVPEKKEFNSADWLLTLQGFSYRSTRLLATPEMLEHAQKTQASPKKETLPEEVMSKLEQAVSNTPQFLSTALASCKARCKNYDQQFAVIQMLVSEMSQGKEQEILAHARVCIAYFTALKGLIEQTQAAFQKNGAEGVKAIYPRLVQELALHLKKAGLIQLLDEMPPCALRDHLQAAKKEQPVDTSTFKIDDWTAALLGFQGQGEHLLNKALERLDVSHLFDEITKP